MKLTVFSAKSYDRTALDAANEDRGHEISYLEARLDADTAGLAEGSDAICIFVNDEAKDGIVDRLADVGVKGIALRCAGFNNVELEPAQRRGIRVVRVPAYSPHAVAEHTLGLILALNRKLHRAYSRVREHNFELRGLLGFDLHGKTVGVIGTGRIGIEVCRILKGFGCTVLAYDLFPNDEVKQLGCEYVELDRLFRESRIITLHCPLTPETHHLINADAIEKMRDDVMIVNASRGAVIETPAAIEGLKSRKIGHLALDVYEEEEVFFEDVSNEVLQDDMLARLLTFPNVLVTGHQAFFTAEALGNIAETTLANIDDLAADRDCPNEVKA
ncbi:2-hydroxyacid dehydrogenase [Stratiformator vulcanicus]|uniref:D-lactate dehydrogenase n=1 Tax=Stratiformator vulcanicus TaxID=2527980 RepID=A0A517R1L2_9PLAN|nr:2-hydroxyacid dehydrogenase [Stratiformator vulcanicus]QDT37762.1 D-lactate dehydrogenase [Stratiformator vulcanicus]